VRFIINLRQSGPSAPTNGALAAGSAGSEARLARSTALTLITHGYNVGGASGDSCLNQFVNILPEDSSMDYGIVLWPGDVPWNGFVSKISFPAKLKTAEESARKLANFLWARIHLRHDCAINFVSHSLGARVVLESIRQLKVRGYSNLQHVCLMAAAVEDTVLEDEYSDAAAAVKSIGVLSSQHDNVLKVLFPIGHLAAHFPHWPGDIPHALGFSGPRTRALSYVALKPFPIPDTRDADHGDYLPRILDHPDPNAESNWDSSAHFSQDILNGVPSPQYP
jgi:hypothetical protein